MSKPIRKAVIAAAGMGTRFLPQTKAMPKEMLPIIDKPVIQLVVESAVSAGVEDIIIVTGPTKRAIEDHFDRSIEFETELRSKGKDDLANRLKSIAELANFTYIRQKGDVKGNAVPVINAGHLIGDEPFMYFFADIFIGVSKAGLLNADSIKLMAPDPIIIAMANPEPEIMPDLAKAAGAAVVATGRSDFPNQVNNALGFPGIFRGALDHGVTKITDDHKIAAAEALASLVSSPTADKIIPGPFDDGVVEAVANAIV